jgi:ubiquinone/menaquinone biosynthesis C-methylase UbiE
MKFTGIGIFLTKVLFSIITPPLLVPRISKLRATRFVVAFCFGRSYGNRYQDIIDSFQGRYELAMARGLQRAKKILGDSVAYVLDCGTGTGFVTNQAAKEFPNATFVAFDILPGMIRQAKNNCPIGASDVFHLQADSFELPLACDSMDLILAQNTLPCFIEYARVCRPGGVVVYVDSSSGWVTQKARKLVQKSHLFEEVTGERVDMGFCIVATKSKSSS